MPAAARVASSAKTHIMSGRVVPCMEDSESFWSIESGVAEQLDAQVSVLIDQYGSKKYQVLGVIRRSGSYPLKAEERLLDAVSAAGGVVLKEKLLKLEFKNI